VAAVVVLAVMLDSRIMEQVEVEVDFVPAR